MLLYLTLFIGATFILCGFYCEKHPNQISGISTMSVDKLKNVDLPSMGKLFKRGFIILGISTMLVSGTLYFCELYRYVIDSILAIVLIGATIIITKAQKHNYNERSILRKYSSTLFLIIIALVVGVLQYNSARPTKVSVTPEYITFGGGYGTSFAPNEISKVALWDKLPKIGIRTNGYSNGVVMKGHFKLDEVGKALLFIQQTTPPYLYIELNDGKKIIYNSEEQAETKKIYNAIKKTAEP